MREQMKRGPGRPRMGRPRIYGEQVDFEMRKWSKDLLAKIDARRGTQSRRAYIEYLLRTHPEMNEPNEFFPSPGNSSQNT